MISSFWLWCSVQNGRDIFHLIRTRFSENNLRHTSCVRGRRKRGTMTMNEWLNVALSRVKVLSKIRKLSSSSLIASLFLSHCARLSCSSRRADSFTISHHYHHHHHNRFSAVLLEWVHETNDNHVVFKWIKRWLQFLRRKRRKHTK